MLQNTAILVASRMASEVISEHIPGKAHPQVPNGLCTHSTNLNCLLPSLVSGRPTIQVIDRLQYAKMEEEGLGTSYHVNDICVYIGIDRGGEVLKQTPLRNIP